MDDGNCTSTDPDKFFAFDKDTIEKTKEICFGCEVRIKCLAFALASENSNDALRYGVWGGLDGPERRKLQKQLVELAKAQRAAQAQKEDEDEHHA